MPTAEELKRCVKKAASVYKSRRDASVAILEAAVAARDLLDEKANFCFLGECDRKGYSVWKGSERMSRPILADLMVNDVVAEWWALLATAAPKEKRFTMDPGRANAVVYSIIALVSSGFDIWMSSSRKTPGTFFEVLVGSLLERVLPGYRRTAHVIIPNQAENVSTDIVFSAGEVVSERHPGLVVPVKITTRERVVQPYAHQCILDSVFGEGCYRSVLVCMSEMQREKSAGANAICVPGTIRLFQTHLAQLTALYYLDPPVRYLADDVTSLVAVKTVGDLLCRDLSSLTTGRG